MDSKYNLGASGTTAGPKFSGFGVYKPLVLSLRKKKLLKKKLALQNPDLPSPTKNGTAKPPNGLVRMVAKAALIDESSKQSLLELRKQLPVYKFRDRIIQEIKRNECLIFLGETGSGKTTQIPQFIYESGSLLRGQGICGITQPRRMAAISIAQRVAQEQKSKLGETVGYTVRFEDMTGPKTKIQYMTDGTLLRQALNDRLLMAYSVIVLDEAHERTINTDVLFGLVKAAQQERKTTGAAPLRIVVMSATMDVDHFANYFNGCNVIYLEGRLFPVKVLHVKKSTLDYQEACLYTLFNIHTTAALSDDVLIFLTGQEEIESLAQTINDILKNDQFKDYPMKVFPLYAQLPQHKQLEVFKPLPGNVRKVILSTNIAETSITIKGIKFVIDSGVVKQKAFNPGTRIESLKVAKISQAQAWQRTGRAGRESSGTCYRTYTIPDFHKMPRMNVPEIVRSNLGTTVLQLLALGVDCATFDFMDRPSAELLENSYRLLHDVRAIDGLQTRELTEVGKKMARFPLDPRLSRVLLVSEQFGCLEDALSIVAMLSGENVFVSSTEKGDRVAQMHQRYESKLGDLVTMLNAFKAFQSANSQKAFCYTNYLNYRNLSYASEVRNQLEAICRKCNINGVEPKKTNGMNGVVVEDEDEEEEGASSLLGKKDPEFVNLRKCLLIGFYDNVAQLQKDNHYQTLASRQRAKIHPSSVLNGKERPELLFYTEFLSTGQNYLKQNTVVEAKWLLEMPQLRKHFRNFLEK